MDPKRRWIFPSELHWRTLSYERIVVLVIDVLESLSFPLLFSIIIIIIKKKSSIYKLSGHPEHNYSLAIQSELDCHHSLSSGELFLVQGEKEINLHILHLRMIPWVTWHAIITKQTHRNDLLRNSYPWAQGMIKSHFIYLTFLQI